MNRKTGPSIRTGALLAGILAVGGLAGAAEAGTLQIGSGPYQASSGGEFTAYNVVGEAFDLGQATPPNTGAGTFQTFCVERSESINFGGTYSFSTLSYSVWGGYSGQVPAGSGSDPLDERTAYLYENFWFGTLAYYDFADGVGIAGTRRQWAAALQTAIWFLEGELLKSGVDGPTGTYYQNTSTDISHLRDRAGTGSFSTGSTDWINEKAADFLDLANNAVATGAWSGLGHVQVLHLWKNGADTYANKAQDQLVVVVPLPSTAWAGLGMMVGLGVFAASRRRRRSILA